MISPSAESMLSSLGYFVGLVGLGYSRWFRGGNTGQSWGRWLVDIRLVDATSGQPIGASRAFWRDVNHVLDAVVLLIGFLRPLFQARRQTFADTLMASVVV